ncbi:hypothetical protein ACHAXA_006568 [Cyclostephanos tholiformis]|uniref:Transmembrane protein n=1 Tax=Cyclostephanos tholiformis TaxID=382380 RepID=A0ABD3RRU7_9STRA
MTYQSRGRTIFEVVLAVCFVAFLVGFITVLCIGNYFRAKRAQERQKQRRDAKMAATAGGAFGTAGGGVGRNNNMDGRGGGGGMLGGGGEKGGVDYVAPVLPQQAGGVAGRLL